MTLLEMMVGGRFKHDKMHNFKRIPLLSDILSSQTPTQIFYTSKLTQSGTDGSLATTSITSLAIDSQTQAASAYTTLTEVIVETITQPATTVISTYTSGVAVTDAAQYSSIQASQASATAQTTTAAASTSTASASTSSTAATSSSSSSIDTLVPAIVVPVVVVLAASLALFWFVMRRRHRRQLEDEPDFVMATKPEKSMARGNSSASGSSSTRELVPMSKLEKEAVITSAEVRRSSNQFFPPKYSTAAIGVARPMTPPDKAGTNSNLAKENAPAVPNFSSVRPGTAGRSRPSQDFSSTRSPNSPDNQPRGRNVAPGSRAPPRRGESPFMAGSRRPGPRSLRPADGGIRSRPRTPVEHQPSPLHTDVNVIDPTLLPRPLNAPTPTGAFNGISPISQYSPIIKDSSNTQAATKASSKAGYNNISSKTLLLPERRSQAESLPSPELPPPLTREDMPPRLFANGRNSPAGSSNYQSPTLGADSLPRPGGGPLQDTKTSDRLTEHRLSIISKLSSEDDYVDMELDNKSDVSSLDEREKWEIESDRLDSGSRLAAGYGSAAMSSTERPSEGAKKTSGNPNLRDRDSEGPFVLSRY